MFPITLQRIVLHQRRSLRPSQWRQLQRRNNLWQVRVATLKKKRIADMFLSINGLNLYLHMWFKKCFRYESDKLGCMPQHFHTQESEGNRHRICGRRLQWSTLMPCSTGWHVSRFRRSTIIWIDQVWDLKLAVQNFLNMTHDSLYICVLIGIGLHLKFWLRRSMRWLSSCSYGPTR